jgi:hypothetical protein
MYDTRQYQMIQRTLLNRQSRIQYRTRRVQSHEGSNAGTTST